MNINEYKLWLGSRIIVHLDAVLSHASIHGVFNLQIGNVIDTIKLVAGRIVELGTNGLGILLENLCFCTIANCQCCDA